jgi:alkylation response protein AidB-like acyl-CoA dehydrogenase
MNFTFTEEQTQLRDTLRRYLAKEYAFDRRREIIASPPGTSAEVWGQFADLGILALPFREEDGGLGGSPTDTMLVMEELGRALVVEPYLSTVILAGGIIARAGSPAQREAILPGIAAGELRLALAHGEAQARFALDDVATTARRDGDSWVLDGAKAMVRDGEGADQLLVSARSDAGISLFLVPGNAEGLDRQGHRTHDGGRVAEVTLKGVRVPADALVGAEGGGLGLVETATDRGIAALCAEAVGAMEVLIALTLEYVKTRKQFGVAIGSFQVLQHRLADMVLELELARSITYLATAKLDVADGPERRKAISGAKFLVGRAARTVGQEAVQLHGGMGVTDELATGHYFKRLTLINASFGDRDHHLERFGAAG